MSTSYTTPPPPRTKHFFTVAKTNMYVYLYTGNASIITLKFMLKWSCLCDIYIKRELDYEYNETLGLYTLSSLKTNKTIQQIYTFVFVSCSYVLSINLYTTTQCSGIPFGTSIGVSLSLLYRSIKHRAMSAHPSLFFLFLFFLFNSGMKHTL